MVAASIALMVAVWFPLVDAIANQKIPDNSEYLTPKPLHGIDYMRLGSKIPDHIEKEIIGITEFRGAHSLGYISTTHPDAVFYKVRTDARQCLVATKNDKIGAIECGLRVGVKDIDLIEQWKKLYPEGQIETSPAIGQRTFSYSDKTSHEIIFDTLNDFLITTKKSIQLERQHGLINEYNILVVIDHGNNRWTERLTDLSILPPWNDTYRVSMVNAMNSTETLIDTYLSESGFIDRWLMKYEWYMKFLIHEGRIPQHLLNSRSNL